jgi:hypothetical protein
MRFEAQVRANEPLSNSIRQLSVDVGEDVLRATGDWRGAEQFVELGHTIAYYTGPIDQIIAAAMAAPEASILGAGFVATLFAITQEGAASGIKDWVQELWKLHLGKPFAAGKDGRPIKKGADEGDDGEDEDDNNECPLKKDAPVSSNPPHPSL